MGGALSVGADAHGAGAADKAERECERSDQAAPRLQPAARSESKQGDDVLHGRGADCSANARQALADSVRGAVEDGALRSSDSRESGSEVREEMRARERPGSPRGSTEAFGIFIDPPAFASTVEHEELPAQAGDVRFSDGHRVARMRESSWERLCVDLLSSLALTPSMTAFYAEQVTELLTNSLCGIEQVLSVDFVQCSFPSVPRERPLLRLVRWLGLHYGEFELAWAPKSWWIAASVHAAIGCQLLVKLHGMSVKGIVRTALSPDCSALRLSFCANPKLAMTASSSVLVGTIPVPLQDWTEAAVLKLVHELVHSRLVSPNSQVFVLRRTLLGGAEELDIARRAAERARCIRCNRGKAPS